MSRIEHVDPAASAASAKALTATMAGAGTLTWGGWTANDVAMVVGAVVAVLGFACQWYYRHKEYKLKEREHAARMGLYE